MAVTGGALATTRSARAENKFREFAELGLSWDHKEGIAPSNFDLERGLKNQVRLGTPIDHATVDRYAADMRNGDVFEAVWAERLPNGKLCVGDGNHRLVAAIQADGTPLGVYILDGPQDVLRQLWYEANRDHGRTLTAEERLHHALWFIEGGMLAEDAARRTGAPIKDVKRALSRQKADDRAAANRIPMNVWKALPLTTQTRLDNIKTDEGFRAGVDLVLKARMTMEEISTLVTHVNETSDGARQQQMVAMVADGWADRIAAVKVGRAPAPGKGGTGRGGSLSARLAMALGQVCSLPDPAVLVTGVGEESRGKLHTRVDQAIEALEAIRKVLAA